MTFFEELWENAWAVLTIVCLFIGGAIMLWLFEKEDESE